MSTTDRPKAGSTQHEFQCRDIAETKAMAPLPLSPGDVAHMVEAWIWRAVLIGAASLPLWMAIRVALAIIAGRFP